MKKVIILLMVLGFIKSYAQDRINTINLGFIDSVQSTVLNETRKIWVHVPQKTIQDGAQQKYPVLYLLDGPDHFISVTGLIQKLSTSFGDEVCPEMIIIGIESPDRVRDFLPEVAQNGSLEKSNIENDNFTTFLEKELIPYVDSVYPTAKFRILVGHSLGGLKAINTMIYHTPSFNSYIAIDPSLGHFKNKWFDIITKDVGKNDYSKTSLFLAMAQTMPGGLTLTEIKDDTTSASNHMRAIMKFADIMNANDQIVDFSWKFYPGETHGSLPLIATYDAIHYIFRWYDTRKIRFIYKIENDGDSVRNIISNHFSEISKKMGYEYSPPENYIKQIADYFYGKRKFKTTFSLLKLNSDNYPYSAYSKYFLELAFPKFLKCF